MLRSIGKQSGVHGVNPEKEKEGYGGSTVTDFSSDFDMFEHVSGPLPRTVTGRD